ncbi:uroporphyrinogen-III C-methyltransferase [Bombella sp. ESL0387]|nr:uroporphyrinogen-III C-methyltransferase [Bombella sp. ESL0387]
MTTKPFFYLPIVLRTDQRDALLVGGGQVAVQKMRLLKGRCRMIHIWAETLHPELAALVEQGQAVFRQGRVAEDALQAVLPDMALVFAATDDEAVNEMVARQAHALRIPVCVVDAPALSSFITPALVDRSPVQVAITTGGASPVLARRVRQMVEAMLPARMGEAARFMQKQRGWLKDRLPGMKQRQRVWESFVDGPAYEAALAGEEDWAREQLEQLVAEAEGEADRPQGEVWLVGAGPGNPDWLTLAALRLMQNADSVLYDNLVAPDVLDRVRRDAERVYVGKKRSHHTLPQSDIEAEMLRRARRGERVLRLKGGDPFVFGRGGEEMETLLAANVPVRVVPGITAANGCAAAAGIPLTHRDCAQSCVVVTGHARADGTLNLHWPSLARRGQTVVIYMGLSSMAELCWKMQDHGLPESWPVAVVHRGSCADQRCVTGTLGTIAEDVRRQGLQSPVLIIVGEVVHHRGEVVQAVPGYSTSKESA